MESTFVLKSAPALIKLLQTSSKALVVFAMAETTITVSLVLCLLSKTLMFLTASASLTDAPPNLNTCI